MLAIMPRVPQLGQQRQQGQAKNGEMVAVDGRKQPHALFLDLVAADGVADAVPVPGEIVVEIAVGQIDAWSAAPRPHGARRVRRFHRRRRRRAGGGSCRATAQLLARLIRAFGLGKDRAFKLQHLVAADHEVSRTAICHLAGLHLGQGIGHVARLRPFGQQRRRAVSSSTPGGDRFDLQTLRTAEAAGGSERWRRGQRRMGKPVDIRALFRGRKEGRKGVSSPRAKFQAAPTAFGREISRCARACHAGLGQSPVHPPGRKLHDAMSLWTRMLHKSLIMH